MNDGTYTIVGVIAFVAVIGLGYFLYDLYRLIAMFAELDGKRRDE
jgi:hypothetical protein